MKFYQDTLRTIKQEVDKKKEKIRHKHFAKKASALFDMHSNKNIIVLSSDCVGGRLMNDYQLPVNTPTVNVWFSDDGFLKICENPTKYFQIPIIMNGLDKKGHFIGIVDDIVCHFGHETDPEKAKKKWTRGCKQFYRALKSDYEICVIMNDRNDFDDSFVKRFEALPYQHKILFTHKPHPEIPHVFYMKGEDSLPYVKTMTLFENFYSTRRRYDRFDFYHWFLDMLKEENR